MNSRSLNSQAKGSAFYCPLIGKGLQNPQLPFAKGVTQMDSGGYLLITCFVQTYAYLPAISFQQVLELAQFFHAIAGKMHPLPPFSQ
jgi:hypothetical protein